MEQMRVTKAFRKEKAIKALDELSKDSWWGILHCPYTGVFVQDNRKIYEEAWGCDVRRSNALLVARRLQEDGFEGEFHNNHSEPIYFRQDGPVEEEVTDEHAISGSELMDFLNSVEEQGGRVSFVKTHECADCEKKRKSQK